MFTSCIFPAFFDLWKRTAQRDGETIFDITHTNNARVIKNIWNVVLTLSGGLKAVKTWLVLLYSSIVLFHLNFTSSPFWYRYIFFPLDRMTFYILNSFVLLDGMRYPTLKPFLFLLRQQQQQEQLTLICLVNSLLWPFAKAQMIQHNDFNWGVTF